MLIKISGVKVGERLRKDVGDLEPLINSIKTVGLLHPIVVTPDGTLIAGYRRLEAFKQMGMEEIPATVLDVEDILRAEYDENVVRKDFTIEERVEITGKLWGRVAEEAKERQEATQTKPGERVGEKKVEDIGSVNFTGPVIKGQTRDIIAKYFGESGVQLEKERKIVEAVKKEPEKFESLLEKIDRGELSVDYAYQMVNRAEKAKEPPPVPDGKFDVIYADPPWKYELKLRGSAEYHYSTLETWEIARMKIPSADDAVLFLWATAPNLPDALEVMTGWGFDYKTNAVWVKPSIGTGYYFRGQHELLLVGIKGVPGVPFEADRPPSVIAADRGEHSEKPEAVYELIERMYPNRRYLELFARKKRDGWTVWGNEVEE